MKYTIIVPDPAVDIRDRINRFFDFIDDKKLSKKFLNKAFRGESPPLALTVVTLHYLDIQNRRMTNLVWPIVIACYLAGDYKHVSKYRARKGGGGGRGSLDS